MLVYTLTGQFDVLALPGGDARRNQLLMRWWRVQNDARSLVARVLLYIIKTNLLTFKQGREHALAWVSAQLHQNSVRASLGTQTSTRQPVLALLTGGATLSHRCHHAQHAKL